MCLTLPDLTGVWGLHITSKCLASSQSSTISLRLYHPDLEMHFSAITMDACTSLDSPQP